MSVRRFTPIASLLALLPLLAGCNSVNMSRARVERVGNEPAAASAGKDVVPPKLVHSGDGSAHLLFGSKASARVEATVTADGRVVDVQVVETDNPTFAAAFARTIESSRFRPARKAGEPVDVRMSFYEERIPGTAVREGWNDPVDTIPVDSPLLK